MCFCAHAVKIHLDRPLKRFKLKAYRGDLFDRLAATLNTQAKRLEREPRP